MRNSVTSVGEQAGPEIDEAILCRAFRDAFAERLGIRFREGMLTPEEETLKIELMANKYDNASWNGEGSTSWTSGL